MLTSDYSAWIPSQPELSHPSPALQSLQMADNKVPVAESTSSMLLPSPLNQSNMPTAVIVTCASSGTNGDGVEAETVDVAQDDGGVAMGDGKLGREERTFTCFPKLPIELRDMIWKLALPGPQTIHLRAGNKPTICKISCAQGPTALLGVNGESRELASKLYKRIRPGVPIFINFLVDTLNFENTSTWFNFALELLDGIFKQNPAKDVSYGVVELELRYASFEDASPGHFFHLIPTFFPNLREVSFNSNLDDGTYDSLTKPKQMRHEWARLRLETEWKKDCRTTKVPKVAFV